MLADLWKGGECMNKTMKRVLIIVGCVVVAALLAHLVGTYLFPYISKMHSGGAY
jgi:putative Mn2+ efflux pump MntP